MFQTRASLKICLQSLTMVVAVYTLFVGRLRCLYQLGMTGKMNCLSHIGWQEVVQSEGRYLYSGLVSNTPTGLYYYLVCYVKCAAASYHAYM